MRRIRSHVVEAIGARHATAPAATHGRGCEVRVGGKARSGWRSLLVGRRPCRCICLPRSSLNIAVQQLSHYGRMGVW